LTLDVHVVERVPDLLLVFVDGEGGDDGGEEEGGGDHAAAVGTKRDHTAHHGQGVPVAEADSGLNRPNVPQAHGVARVPVCIDEVRAEIHWEVIRIVDRSFEVDEKVREEEHKRHVGTEHHGN